MYNPISKKEDTVKHNCSNECILWLPTMIKKGFPRPHINTFVYIFVAPVSSFFKIRHFY